MAETEMKDVTPKGRVRVQAGREGGSRAEFAPPANLAPTNLPVPGGPEPTNMLAVIARAAADPRTDTAKMQALLAMQKEIIAEEARLAYTKAKLSLTRKLPIINKDGKIEFKDKGAGKATLRFASFENINEVLKPLLDEFGFDLWFSSEPGVAGMINVVGHLDHENGHTRSTIFPMPHDPSGGKSGAQGWASAFSFGKRIATIGLLNLQTRALEDRDSDGNVGTFKPAKGGALAQVPEKDETITPTQRTEIVKLITEAKISEANFCAHYGVNQIIQLPAALYNAAVQAIEDHKAKKAGNGNG